jgi:hypothetical protein
VRKLLPVGIVVALLAIAAWWWSRGDAPPPDRLDQAASAAAAGAPPTLTSGSAIQQPPGDTTGPMGTVEREPVAAFAVTRLVHTLRGRAVDTAGQPLAGIEAGLIGRYSNDGRAAEWTRRNPDPEGIEERMTTAADGVFTFAVWPPPPFLFSLRLHGSGVATRKQSWSEWAPGGTTDLGDVTLQPGTLLRGRVIDSAGAPVPKCEVTLQGAAGPSPTNGFDSWSSATTAEDGTFSQRWALLAGVYKITAGDQRIERGEQVTLSGEPEQFVDIVVRRIGPADSIRGVVVDDLGTPVPGVTVHANGATARRTLATDADGRFCVLRHEGAAATVTFHLLAQGFAPLLSQEQVEWGRQDVRLVMIRGKEVLIRVVRDADGTPVEDFALRVIPAKGGHQAADHKPHGKAPHEDGCVSARGIAIGKHRVIVTPRDDALAIGTVPIEVGPNGAPPVTVRLAAAQPRVVRVITVGGSPCSRANVQLVDPCGERCRVGMSPYAADGLYIFTPSKAIELAAATTDANGECTLPAPVDRALALLLPGPGHIAMVVDPVVFPFAGPLVVTVGSGAILRGKLGPEAAWAELVQLAGGPEAGSRRRPTVSVTRGERGELESFPKTRHAVDEDGSFELTGIPAGRWNASLSYNAGPSGAWKSEPLGVVDLVDGQVTTIAPDLSGLLSGTIEALVLRDGAPFADVHVLFSRLVAGESRPQSEEGVKTDVEGRANARVRTGQYVVTWEPPSNDGTYMVLRSTEVADVRPGETTRQTFTIASGTVRVRLLDSTGNPVPRVQINLTDIAGTGPSALGTTRADGRVERLLPAGTFHAFVLPKRLQDEQASREFHRSVTDPAQRAAVRVPIGAFTVRSGQTTEVELRLPEDW